MNYIVAVDLEGIHGVVGRPYEGLTKGSEDHALAVENAIKEINAVCGELFAAGETEILLWDNHGTGDNIDISRINGNVKLAEWWKYPCRMEFLKECNCKGIFYLGYHAKAGSLGVLAHTYSSSIVQYYKLNGKAVGEFEIDSILATQYGIAPYFASSDDVCVEQMKEFCPHLETALTKIAKGRNEAELFSADEVLEKIKEGVRAALKAKHEPICVEYPLEAEFRFTRIERACEIKKNLAGVLNKEIEFGEDCHILKAKLENVQELELFLRGNRIDR